MQIINNGFGTYLTVRKVSGNIDNFLMILFFDSATLNVFSDGQATASGVQGRDANLSRQWIILFLGINLMFIVNILKTLFYRLFIISNSLWYRVITILI